MNLHYLVNVCALGTLRFRPFNNTGSLAFFTWVLVTVEELVLEESIRCFVNVHEKSSIIR